MVLGDDPRLRRMAAFDAVVNNTDRKGGHILPVDGGRLIHGVDHGVCFSTGAQAPDGAVGLARPAVRSGRARGLAPHPRGPRWRARACRSATLLSRREVDGDRRAGGRPAGDRPLPAARPDLAGHPVAAVLTSARRRGARWGTIGARRRSAMRRWNGWSEEGVEAHLPDRARDLLAQLVGPGTPPREPPSTRSWPRSPPARLADDAHWTTDPLDRVLHARGQSLPDWIALRSGRLGPVPDAVARPADAAEVRAVMDDAAAARREPDPVRRRHERRRRRDAATRRPAGRERGPGRGGPGCARSTRPAGSPRSGRARSVRRSRRPWRRPAGRSATTRSRSSARPSAAGS